VVTRDGEKACMFGATEDRTDAMAFARRSLNDRHHFRFIVTPLDRREMTDLKALHPRPRHLVGQMESDLGIRLGLASPMGTPTPAFASRGRRRRR
jgi:type IV secretory pathway VirD2 relaxase